MYELQIKMRDSINSQATQKASLKKEMQYDFEKKRDIADAEYKSGLKNQEIIAEEKNRKQKLVTYFVIGGLILVLAFAGFILNRFKVTKRQKQVIEVKEKETQLQKHIIEEKHKEITDSINYAERIQRSFIASKEMLDENLSDYFVLFKPKDVVSGDFYWASILQNGNFALVTADSTGHGVPGAIMSLLNITSLEKAVETLSEPSEIFNSTRKTIIERLKKDGSEHGGKDGMDASLTVYDFKNNKLSIAVANNPVWIMRGDDIIDIKPDKMPIGKGERDSILFTQQEIDLQKGDVIYTLTDGFPDQFGGEKGKKFMSKRLRDLLSLNSMLPMNEQKALLENTFADWIGNLEQIDDVCLIGVRISS
jgi:serine phosphatase RsbU (regulator of sigma subunit)